MTTTIPTTLFRLRSTIDDWPHRGRRYNGVQVEWLITGGTLDRDHAALIEGFDRLSEDDKAYARPLVDELFTEEEADAFADYLRREHGAEVERIPVPLPLSPRSADGVVLISFGSVSAGGDADFYMLAEEEGYDLPFLAWGYYRLDQDPAPVLLPPKPMTVGELRDRLAAYPDDAQVSQGFGRGQVAIFARGAERFVNLGTARIPEDPRCPAF